jgi:hypothetical protein
MQRADGSCSRHIEQVVGESSECCVAIVICADQFEAS